MLSTMKQTQRPLVPVHVWSDVACPWCYVGKERLFKAAEQMGVDLELEWHSFELDPRPLAKVSQGETYVGRLAKKYGRTHEQAQGMVDQMTKVGAEDGISFHFDSAIFANTFDAHRLLKWALTEGPEVQSALARALFDAHLCEGKDLNDPQALVSIAASVGLDPDRATALLASEDYGGEVRKDEDTARSMGVSGVPFYVIGSYGVGGAQQPETFEKVIEKALAEAELSKEASPANPSEQEGAYCGLDGC